MNSLIKYIFLILAIMVNNNLLSQDSIPVYVFQLQNDNKFILSNKGISIITKPISGKWKNAIELTKKEDGFIYFGNPKEWIELKITDSLGNHYYRKTFIRNGKEVYISKSNYHFYSYRDGIKRPIFPEENIFHIEWRINLYSPSKQEIDKKLTDIGLDKFICNQSTLYRLIETKKYSHAQQIDELLTIEGIVISPVAEITTSSIQIFSDGAHILFSSHLRLEQIKSILKKCGITSFSPINKENGRDSYLKDEPCGQYFYIHFTSKQMIDNYSFLKILDQLYMYPDVLEIRNLGHRGLYGLD